MREIEKVNGIEVFKQNKIVSYLLDTNPHTDLNIIWKLHRRGIFTDKEIKEFYQLIGYSISGYNEIFEVN